MFPIGSCPKLGRKKSEWRALSAKSCTLRPCLLASASRRIILVLVQEQPNWSELRCELFEITITSTSPNRHYDKKTLSWPQASGELSILYSVTKPRPIADFPLSFRNFA